MSIIVAREDENDNVIHVAADRRVSSGNFLENISYSKLLKKGDTIIGCVGACRMLQILEYHFEFTWTSLPSMMYNLPTALREVFSSHHFGDHKSDRAANFGESLLIAAPFGLFTVHADYCILKHEKYAAIGSGRDFALGAMESLDYLEPKDSITKLAVEASKKFDSNCGGLLDCAIVKLKK